MYALLVFAAVLIAAGLVTFGYQLGKASTRTAVPQARLPWFDEQTP